MDFLITDEQREYSVKLAKAVTEMRKTINFKAETDFNNSYSGFLAEVVICDALSKPRPICLSTPDNGADVTINGKRINIKVSTCHNFNINYNRHHEAKGSTDAYLFTKFNPGLTRLSVYGWLPWENISTQRLIKPNDGRPAFYSITPTALKEIKIILGD